MEMASSKDVFKRPGVIYAVAPPGMHGPAQKMLSRIQAALGGFFLGPSAVDITRREEGGLGLVYLESRGVTFRVQFVQRLLCGPSDLLETCGSSCVKAM